MTMAETVALVLTGLFVTFLIISSIRIWLSHTSSMRQRRKRFDAFFAELQKEAIPHTSTMRLTYDVDGTGRSTALIDAETDARFTRFVTDFWCFKKQRFKPARWWGNAFWVELRVGFTRCRTCSGPLAALHRFKAICFVNGAGLALHPIASLCLDCHRTDGTDGMNETDIAFVHRCRNVALQLSRQALRHGDDPYRSAA